MARTPIGARSRLYLLGIYESIEVELGQDAWQRVLPYWIHGRIDLRGTTPKMANWSLDMHGASVELL